MKSLYVAAKIKELHDPHFLTSEVMRLSEDLWLFDLTPVLNFWNYRCAAQKISLSAFLSDIFKNLEPHSIAVLALHPWQAFLQLTFFAKKVWNGFASLLDLFNAKMYQEMTFDVWFEAVESLLPFVKQKNQKKNLALFQRSVTRLHLKKVGDLKHATFAHFERRYGAFVATVLDWTFHAERPFPWQTYKPVVTPEVKRDLDYITTVWGEISFLLVEDLDRLADQVSGYVLKLSWTVILHPFEEKSFELNFRNPHDLKSERKVQDTSLRQFEAAFMQLAQTLCETENLIMISSWRIAATAWLSKLFYEKEFFEENATHSLLTLENKLKGPLVKFSLCADFSPEHSFASYTLAAYAGAENKNPGKEPATRPLFVFAAPRPLVTPPSKVIFTERVATHWWDQEEEYQVRDYFFEIAQTPRWLFWEHLSQQWYEHGLFG